MLQTCNILTYPDLLNADPTPFVARDILAPTNVGIGINNHILNLLPNTSRCLLSSNSLIKSNPRDIEEVTSTEFLQAVDVPGVPPHNLHLKVGCVVMFIRNVNFDSGIVHGEKGIVRAVSPRIVDVEVTPLESPSLKCRESFSKLKSALKASPSILNNFPSVCAMQLLSTKAKVRL